MQHRTVIIQDGNRGHSGCSYDIAEFVQWIVDSVRQCISMVKAGVYNSYIEQNLPPQHRTGTIMLKNYWNFWPDQRESFFRNITSEEAALFCKMAYSQLPLEEITDRIYKMTANDFYKMCALGYRANHYDGCEKTAKEQYYLFADGRDDGLDELDPDSPEEFHSWLNNRERFGGHPWEVCRGDSSTHISLYVHEDLKGCILILSGNAYIRTIETVKFYLVLKAADVPVYLNDANLLADRLTEREIIGIVPRGVMPICCSSYFPGQKVTSYLNLPDEHREEFIRACNWQSEAEVMLNEKTEGS